ncbi:MAG: hypothetical protein K2N94_03870 [Lachnospiraceae bacterium]|nr:hypothetical protein [Lachnospiraceae bacterium]
MGYNKYSDGSEGPQDFYVYQGKVYLLDSENDRILVYQFDTFQKCIELDAYCTMIEILDDEIYVLAWTKKEIRKYDMEGRLQASYPLGGCDASRVRGIVKDGNRVMIINDAGQTLAYNDFYHGFSGVRNDVELVDFSIHGKKKYSVNGISMIEYLTDVSSDYAILHRYNNQTDHLIGEEYIVKRCGEESVGYYDLDLEAWAVLPMRYFRVIDEKPYLMSCYKDKVIVREVVFSEGGKDIFLEDTAVFQEVLKKEEAESADHTALAKSVSAADKTSLTRAQVISRAESMRPFYWTLE